ncbi:(d)CMP kinase [Naumannella halotolerans]|uniref:Cytidylate kinase n=1 Tax=Naumannella halotolerans TaxID=993414 RepID=A0A4R7J834_9ACTN|nr:(d)CMP kinase [Naumannella halotolerans]TDT33435.1 cytidylate kinase [Naumannella halotolerans]
MTDDVPLVIAIDGPSGSGKSSASRGVAERLGLGFLDTGSMYRAVTWAALDRRIPLDDVEVVAELARTAVIEVSTDPRQFWITIDGTEVTAPIREPGISAVVSKVATNLAVREALIARQRQIITETGGIVAEGRDLTTVVVPDAPVRVLLVADPDARVRRRFSELEGKADEAAVTDQVVRRDAEDSTVAAFTEAADGVTVIDSTELDLSQVIDTIVELATAAHR